MIFLGILAVVLLLLLCSVRVRAAYRDTLRLRISYLFSLSSFFLQKRKSRRSKEKKNLQKKGRRKSRKIF